MNSLRKIRIFAALALPFALVAALSSCSDDGGEDAGEPTVTRFGYRLDFDETYHRVVRYVAVDRGLSSFDVKEVSYHYFAKSSRRSRTGVELCDIVETGAFGPDSSSSWTFRKERDDTMTYSDGSVETFYIRKGLACTDYYYF